MLTKLLSWLSRRAGNRTEKCPRADLPKAEVGLRYVARGQQDPPESCEPGVLYLVEDGAGQPWLAALRCPCGCHANIQLPMTPPARPRWQISGGTQKPTLWPSVRRTTGCRSHFVLKQGRVIWCDDRD